MRCSPPPGSSRSSPASRAGSRRLLADLPGTFATPEIRVDCPDDAEVRHRRAGGPPFRCALPGQHDRRRAHDIPDGWGLVRASNTQPILVLRFEATDQASLADYRREVIDWLATQGVRD